MKKEIGNQGITRTKGTIRNSLVISIEREDNLIKTEKIINEVMIFRARRKNPLIQTQTSDCTILMTLNSTKL